MCYTDEMGTFSKTMAHTTSTELLKGSMKLQQHLQELLKISRSESRLAHLDGHQLAKFV